MAARAASMLARSLQEAGRTAEAAAAAERALELAPGDETTFRSLVALLIETNNHARAQSVARKFIEYLASELGVAPSAETTRLLREFRGLRHDEPIVMAASPAARDRQARQIDMVTASLIMRGRHQWHQRTRSAVERAIAYFTAATERDPRAVDAWCGLADSWTVMAGRSYAPPGIAIERAAGAADRALRLDDTVSATSASVGGLNIIRRRWQDAELALRRSIALDPRNADAHHWLSMTLLTGFGLREEAVREQTIAVSLNPVLPMLVGVLGWQRYLRGEYDLSRSNMEPAVDLNADFEEGHAGLARAAARLGDEVTVTRAIEAGLNRRRDLRGDLLAEKASAFAILGDTHRARQLALEASEYEAMPINLALAWASVGDARRALECLERESFQVYWAPQAVWWDPRFDQIRDERRFARVVDRVARVWSSEWR
jgi:tetratricopeptide (TPR) repeat protein